MDSNNGDSDEQSSMKKVTDELDKLLLQDSNNSDDYVAVVADWIRKSRRVLILTGAGVSVSAGIPDFRTPGTGLYDNLQKYRLPFPEAVFVLDFYRQNPWPFLSLAKELWPGLKHTPTITHSFMSLLAKDDKLLRIYSQNIDGLEYEAGIPADYIVECHGHFRTASCIDCHTPMDPQECKDIILNTDNAPNCGSCGGIVKPDIVFFGESLPSRFHNLLGRDTSKADLLLIMGTSLQVAPVSMIPEYVNCKRVLINRDAVGDFEDRENNDKNIFLPGDCDDTIRRLVEALGWQAELEALHKSNVERIQQTQQKEDDDDNDDDNTPENEGSAAEKNAGDDGDSNGKKDQQEDPKD